MAPRRTTFTLLALVLPSLLLVSACGETSTQPNTPLGGMSRSNAAPPSDYVATPAGWYHRSCVHEIPNGARVDAKGLVTRSDRSTFQIPQCSYPIYPSAPGLSAQAIPASPTNNGWIEFASYQLPSGNSFRQLTAGWHIGAAPTGAYTGTQLFYSFPGLEDLLDPTVYIIQPVIQYGYNGSFGGSYWTAASWRCNSGSDCRYGTPIVAAVGDSVYGSVQASACVNGICTWTISVVDVTKGTRSDWTADDTDNYDWVTGGAVEVNDLTECNQYPDTGVYYSSISLYDRYGSRTTPAWANSLPLNPSPSCGFDVASGPTTVNLFYNRPPPPPPPSPLSNSIYANPPSYTAQPTGGTLPYSYSWEWCAINCYTQYSPAKASSSVPDVVSQGWHTFSTSRSVQWTMSQSTLRSTVTDAHSAQAVATNYVQ